MHLEPVIKGVIVHLHDKAHKWLSPAEFDGYSQWARDLLLRTLLPVGMEFVRRAQRASEPDVHNVRTARNDSHGERLERKC